MLATEWIIGNPMTFPKLQDWCLVLCGMCVMVPLARESEPPMQCNALAPHPAEEQPEAVEKHPHQHAYMQCKLDCICEFCSSPATVEEDQTAKVLPMFWHEFKKVQGKFHLARAHMESWFNHHWLCKAPRHQQFILPALLKHMVTLDFDGQDTTMIGVGFRGFHEPATRF